MSRLRRSFFYAVEGIKHTFKGQQNFKFHVFAAILAIVLGFALGLSQGEWMWLLVAIALVLAAELFNTALESLTDLASPAIHPLAKVAKDAAAGAVLVMALFALLIGILLFVPKLLALIQYR